MFSAQSLHSVLSRLIEPPRTESLRASKLRLQDLGALTPDEKLTPLGYHLASLPVDVRIGKLMLFGTIFRCLDPALTIAASLAFKSPFVSILNHVSRFESSNVFIQQQNAVVTCSVLHITILILFFSLHCLHVNAVLVKKVQL